MGTREWGLSGLVGVDLKGSTPGVGCEGVGAKGQTLEEMVWYDSTFVVVVDQLRQYKQQLAAKTRVKILFLLIFNVC